jgi:ubiquinone/menaquinone biosynthesis C-methylase UbiE
MLKKYLTKIYLDACAQNISNIATALALTGPHSHLLDIGCWDGEWTAHFAKIAHAEKTFGIEPVTSPARTAKSRGISVFVTKADQKKWPLPDNSIDCIVSNQVVEHLTDMDKFFQEASRVLKTGGVIITSTNNLSSFHNILAICMGWAPFDLSNSSVKSSGIGNPFSLHKQETSSKDSTWIHKCIYTTKWLNDWQSLYRLQPVMTFGAGLYPFPASFGRFVKKYSAFITTVNRKI